MWNVNDLACGNLIFLGEASPGNDGDANTKTVNLFSNTRIEREHIRSQQKSVFGGKCG